VTVSTIAKPHVGPDFRRAEVDRPRQPLDPQTSVAWRLTSSDVRLSLEIRVLELGAFRRIRLMVVKMTVRPIAKLSE